MPQNGDALGTLLGREAATGGYIDPAHVRPIPEGQAGRPFPKRAPPKSSQGHNLDVNILTANWVSYAIWRSPTLITYFQSSWIVPDPPEEPRDGQLLYLFNGLQNARRDQIFQPVLQWGVSPWGGGPYWSIIPLFVQPSTGIQPASAPPTQVRSGQPLTGYIRLLNEADSTFTYECGFENMGTPARIQGTDAMVEAVEVLEVYRVVDCSDYPATMATSFSPAQAQGPQGPLQPQWAPTNAVTNCGQHTFVQPSGQVDIHYRAA